MKRLILLSLLLISVCNTSLRAQSSLGIDTTNYNIPATLNYNGTYTFLVNIKNYGPQAFSGAFDVVYAVDTGAFFLDTLVIDTLNANIAVGNEIPDSAYITVTVGGKFRSGINTVVIWPRSTLGTFTTHDSLKLSVWVIGFAGIHNQSSLLPAIVFPNPTQGSLFIANKDPHFVIEQVRILDVSERVVYTETFKGSIDVNKLASGSYTIELLDKSGKASRYKVIKE